MQRFPSLWAQTPPKGPHSAKLWNVYKDLANPDISEGYYVTDTVLDLDAEGSPATRPYTEADHQEQIKKWSTNPALIALEKRMHDFKAELEEAKATWRRRLGRFDDKRVTERDILSMAFLGATDATPSGLSYSFLTGIGIHRRISEDIPLTVRYLGHRQKTQSRYHPRSGESQELRSRLRSANHDSIPRILYPLLHLDHGRALISECAKNIIAGITKDVASMTPEQAVRVSIFLRNLSYNLVTRNLDFNSPALEAALKRLAKRYPTDKGSKDTTVKIDRPARKQLRQ